MPNEPDPTKEPSMTNEPDPPKEPGSDLPGQEPTMPGEPGLSKEPGGDLPPKDPDLPPQPKNPDGDEDQQLKAIQDSYNQLKEIYDNWI